jgi:capsular exopolysaccharide synthesis family protein
MEERNEPTNLPAPSSATVGRKIVSLPNSAPLLAERLEEISRGNPVVYLRIILRHKWLVVLMTCLGTLGGFLAVLLRTPVYQSRTSIEVQGFNENFLNLTSFNPTSSPGSDDPTYEMMTQVKVMESESLLERTMQRLRREKKTDYIPPVDRLDKFRHWLPLAAKPEINTEQGIKEAVRDITVKSPRSTHIIEVTADSVDPNLAADFANILVDEFIQKNLDDRWKTIQRTGEWLTRQLDDLKVKLEQSEKATQEYALSAGLQFTTGSNGKEGDQENTVSANVRFVQEQLMKARAERMLAQSRYELVASSPPEALPQVLDDPSLREYEIKIVELKRQRAEVSPFLTRDHPRLQKLESEIAEMASALETARQRVVLRLRNEYAASASHEKMLDDEFTKELTTVSSKAAMQAHYEILKREEDTNRQLYDTMLARVKETSIAAAMNSSNFRIVDPAKPADVPFKPSALIHLVLGFGLGTLLGVIIVYCRELSDRSIQQPGDSSLFFGAPELGVVPSDRLSIGPKTAVAAIRNRKLSQSTTKAAVELATWHRQSSLVAESFRALLTSVMFSDRPPKVLVIASPNPKEGKTTVACNLSIALTETSQRVLLVDADMRRPCLHRLFDLKNDIGLSKLLRRKESVEVSDLLSAVRETGIPGHYVLTSGPWAANLSTLFYSPRLREIIEAARANFDVVIIDTPPMLAIADGRLLAKNADSVLMVLRAGKTTRSDGLMAIQRFVSDGSPLLGTVLVDWHPDRNGYGYNYKYYSKHADYYSDTSGTDADDPATGKRTAG